MFFECVRVSVWRLRLPFCSLVSWFVRNVDEIRSYNTADFTKKKTNNVYLKRRVARWFTFVSVAVYRWRCDCCEERQTFSTAYRLYLTFCYTADHWLRDKSLNAQLHKKYSKFSEWKFTKHYMSHLNLLEPIFTNALLIVEISLKLNYRRLWGWKHSPKKKRTVSYLLADTSTYRLYLFQHTLHHATVWPMLFRICQNLCLCMCLRCYIIWITCRQFGI